MKLYIPTYNSAAFLKTLQVDPRFEVVVVDNCSQDDSVGVAEKNGWEVVRQKKHCGRTENWHTAIEHFLHCKSTWGKWLFSGDRLYDDCYDLLEAGIEAYPEARLIVSEYEIVSSKHAHPWHSLPATRLVSPLKAMELAATKGNWFGSPIAHAFHREAVEKGFTFGKWHWVADMQFLLSMSYHSPVLYLKKQIGQFHADARKVYTADQYALNSSVEEFLIRKEAAALWLQISGDLPKYREIESLLEDDIEGTILQRSLRRSTQQRPPLLRAIPYGTLLKELLLRPFY